MLDPINNAEVFLLNVAFDLFLTLMMARFVLCWVRADYYNPITQFVVKLTQKIILPLRRFLPTVKNIELSSLALILFLSSLKFYLLSIIVVGLAKNYFGLFLLGCADTIKLFINTFFYAILILAILSWVQQGFSPVARLLEQISAPIMRPIQRVVPVIGGFDISPIPALILLRLSIIILVNPLFALGWGIAFG